jgi:FkbM family methyltransferase
VGRLRRAVTTVPESGKLGVINREIRFEHKRLPFLAEDDMRAMLTASYDITLCDYLRKHLSPGDTFLDVGANVGYISSMAASYVGKTGAVHGFEPLPECFARLQVLTQLNPEYRFFFNHIALGENEGVLPITYDPHGESRNASLVHGGTAAPELTTLNVPVKRLDSYIQEKIPQPETIRLIKIDVEGFEFAVLRGLERFFSETKYRPAMICEIKPWEVKNLGYTLQDFVSYMEKFGYRSYELAQDNAEVNLTQLTDMTNVVFRA